MLNLGEKFGKLTIVGDAGKDSRSKRHYLCRCDCGIEKTFLEHNLKSGHTQSCGCASLRNKHAAITSGVFGTWTIIAASPKRGKSGETYRVCQCACGNVLEIQTFCLVKGVAPQCRVCRPLTPKVVCINRKSGHGATKYYRQSPEYISWRCMKERCFNPRHNRYKNYGGRGITVCEQWKDNFSRFLADMGPRPKGYTIDRIDTNGNYEPGNCRWSDDITQQNNRSNNKAA